MTKKKATEDGERGKRPYGSGTVYPYRNGRWVAALRLRDGSRRTLYAAGESEAKAKLRQLASGDLAPARKRSEQLTLGAWLATWLSTIAPRRARASTLRRYALDVDRWSALFGKRKLAEFAVSDVHRALNRWKSEGLSEGSVHHAWRVLRAALNAARREGILTRNVAALAQMPLPQQQKTAALTPVIAGRLLDALDGTRYAEPALLALATGLRLGELTGLTWDDVDLDGASLAVRRQLQREAGCYVLVPLKSVRSRRTLALPAIAVETLRARRLSQSEERLRADVAWQETRNLVFTTAKGAPWHGSTLTHGFQKALLAAGLPRLRWHDLRHGAASLLLAQGASPRVVMEQLGHSSIGITMNLYSHVAPELMRDAADRLDQALTRQNRG